MPTSPRTRRPVGGRIVLSTADTYACPNRFWTTDGTAEGTRLVADLNMGAGRAFEPLYSPVFPAALADRALFFALAPEGGLSLWSSDGTPAVWNGRPYFAATDGVHGVEQWSTDGTSAHTRRVVDLNPGPGSASPLGLTPAADRLYFLATDGASGFELWGLGPGLGDTE